MRPRQMNEGAAARALVGAAKAHGDYGPRRRREEEDPPHVSRDRACEEDNNNPHRKHGPAAAKDTRASSRVATFSLNMRVASSHTAWFSAALAERLRSGKLCESTYPKSARRHK